MTEGYGGLRVVAFESRRAAEMGSLIERHGGEPVSAPTLREERLGDAGPAIDLARSLGAHEVDALVFMTGIGTRAFVAEATNAEAGLDDGAVRASFARVPLIVARGPKPSQVLRELGVTGFAVADEPNAQREVFAVLAARGAARRGARIAVVEHGAPSLELYASLEAAGAHVLRVAVYRWMLVEDTAPLRAALVALARAEARIALFTSASQVDLALGVAAEEGLSNDVLETLRRGLVGSIGPVTTARLRGEGLEPDVEPTHSKMGHLVKATAEAATRVLSAKDAARHES